MNKEVTKFLKEIGSKGGKKTAERGWEYYSKISKIANKKRWDAYRKLKELKKTNDN